MSKQLGLAGLNTVSDFAFVHQFNFEPSTRLEPVPDLPSVTVPDQSFTIEDLIKRHRMGQLTDLEIGKDGKYYDVDHSSPDAEKLMRADVVDREQWVSLAARFAEWFKSQKPGSGDSQSTPPAG